MNTVSFVKDGYDVPKKGHCLRHCSACGHRAVPAERGEDVSYVHPLSLDDYFVQHPSATFFLKVGEGEGALSVQENPFLGVAHGDVLTVDRALQPTLGRLVLAVLEGSFTLCRFTEHEGRRFLVCGTSAHSSQEINEDDGVNIWGVVSALSRKV